MAVLGNNWAVLFRREYGAIRGVTALNCAESTWWFTHDNKGFWYDHVEDLVRWCVHVLVSDDFNCRLYRSLIKSVHSVVTKWWYKNDMGSSPWVIVLCRDWFDSWLWYWGLFYNLVVQSWPFMVAEEGQQVYYMTSWFKRC